MIKTYWYTIAEILIEQHTSCDTNGTLTDYYQLGKLSAKWSPSKDVITALHQLLLLIMQQKQNCYWISSLKIIALWTCSFIFQWNSSVNCRADSSLLLESGSRCSLQLWNCTDTFPFWWNSQRWLRQLQASPFGLAAVGIGCWDTSLNVTGSFGLFSFHYVYLVLQPLTLCFSFVQLFLSLANGFLSLLCFFLLLSIWSRLHCK